MAALLVALALASTCVSSLRLGRPTLRRVSARAARLHHSWAPQDLTRDRPGCAPIPDDDYVKQYQRNPELWPVEFFLIVYRRRGEETSVLVRESANGTSKWGVGSGVPATRWVLSSQSPPYGYEFSVPRIRFDARNYPEHRGAESWSYDKIDIREDAFNGPDAADFEDPELEAFAGRIRRGLMDALEARQKETMDTWETTTLSVVKSVVDGPHSLAAIQGTLRMSGIFARKQPSGPRHVDLGANGPDPADLARSMRIYTMFPQMPDPMPLPSASPEEVRKEIASRESKMADEHGRTYTHISTPNVSNTIHGVYLTLDATALGLDEVPALDLFGTKETKREWVSLQDLRVLAGEEISTEDPKPHFISGYVVRQLVKDGVIEV